MKNSAQFLYRFRGWILGIFAILLWLFPHSAKWIPASSILLALFGIFIRIEARRVIGNHSRGKEIAAPKLITWGIYSRVRHPLYLSNICICYAFILFHLGWQIATFIFAGTVTLFVNFLADSEEKFLQNQFGNEYLVWAEKTPKFIPKRKRNVEENETKSSAIRSIFSAICSDVWTWIWLLFYTLLLLVRRNLELPIF